MTNAEAAPAQPIRPHFARLHDEACFYFLRHGQSQGNASHRIQGHTDSPLSPLGRQQAMDAGRWFSSLADGVVHISSSPLRRAWQTAQIVAQALNYHSPTADARLRELDTGIFSNLGTKEIAQLHPEVWRRFQVESWDAVPQAERVSQLRARSDDYWKHLIVQANSGKKNILSVTHGGLLQWLLKSTMGSSELQWMPLIPAANCGIFLLRARPVCYSSEKRPPGQAADGYYAAWEMMNVVAVSSPDADDNR